MDERERLDKGMTVLQAVLGVNRDDIKELLLHAAIYCGVPAANASFHMAEEVFAQMEAATG
jgi:alkylhydroperoxidase/carboxymuconolactone decarboxylase family protein YurZ